MIAFPHDFYFLYEAFLAIVFAVGLLLGEGLDGIVLFILEFFD